MIMCLCRRLPTLAALPVSGPPHGEALVAVTGVVPHWAQQTRRQAAFRGRGLSVRRRADGALGRGVTLVGQAAAAAAG